MLQPIVTNIIVAQLRGRWTDDMAVIGPNYFCVDYSLTRGELGLDYKIGQFTKNHKIEQSRFETWRISIGFPKNRLNQAHQSLIVEPHRQLLEPKVLSPAKSSPSVPHRQFILDFKPRSLEP